MDLINGSGTGLQAHYYNGINVSYGLQTQGSSNSSYGLPSLSGNSLALTQIDPTIDFNWHGNQPSALVNSQNFSAEWTGQILAPESGNFTFTTKSDDGIRVWIDGQTVIDAWNDHAPQSNSGSIALTAGQKYDIKVDYYQRLGGSIAQLYWSAPDIAQQIVPQSYLYAPEAQSVPEIIAGNGTGLKANYYNGTTLDSNNLALTQVDSTVDFNWHGNQPGALVNSQNFSAEWTGQILAPESGNFTFTTKSDDGIRVWIDGQTVIDAWNDHAPQFNSGSIALTAGQKYDIKVDYYQHLGGSIAQLYWSAPDIAQQIVPQSYLYTPEAVAPNPAPTLLTGSGTGLEANYYNGTTLDSNNLALTQVDPTIDFNWYGNQPGALVNSQNFSAEWTGQILAPESGNFTFTTKSDDGIRVWIDGQTVIDAWNDHAPQSNSGSIALTAGQKYDIKVDYYQHLGGSIAQLYWSAPDIAQQIVPQSYLYTPEAVVPNPAPVIAPPATDPTTTNPSNSSDPTSVLVPTSPDPSTTDPLSTSTPGSDPVAGTPSDSNSSSALSPAFDDSTLPNEGYPSGVPWYLDWAYNPIMGYGNNIPSGWNAFTAWGQVYVQQGWNPPADSNTRVQIRALDAWYLSKSTNQWILLQHADTVSGAAYVEDFANDANQPADVKDESQNGGGISITAGNGYNYHFWTSRAVIPDPSDIAGIYTRFQARLVLDDPNGPDDRATSQYLASDGADYWRSVNSGWAADWSNNGAVGHGRFKFVTDDWQNFSMETLSPEQMSENPPPINA